MKTPEIIVLIPHFNNIDGLSKSLNTISNNEAVDVLIIDDGSLIKPDNELLSKTFTNICNIIVLYLEKNMGIEHALNKGLQYIVDSNNYKFIARLDCGDLCMPDRFKIQKEFFIENPDIYLVGSYAIIADVFYHPLYEYKLPLTHEKIKRFNYFKSAFVHPSVMFRVKSLIKTGFYPIKYPCCEDAAFFHNFIINYRTANIPLPLIIYIIDPEGISQSKYRKQKLSRIHLCFNTFSFRYFNNWMFGLAKNIVCYILGNKLPTRIAIFLNKNKK